MDDYDERCQRCGELGKDRRTLWMACLYEMDELDVPFDNATVGEGSASRHFYTLRVCKDCRASWMRAVQTWFHAPPEDMGQGDVIVRRLGGIEYITREEWEAAQAARG